MDKKLEQLIVIKDEMLTDPTVDASSILNAYRLAETDHYLYALMVDWMKVVDPNIKNILMDELYNYVVESDRTTKIRSEL